MKMKSNAALYIHSICVCVCVCNHLMLELAGVSAADGNYAAVNMQLADDGHASFQLGPEWLWGAAAQTQQANQDVLLRILVGQEGLPAAVGHIIPPHQLHLSAHVSVSESRLLFKSLSWAMSLYTLISKAPTLSKGLLPDKAGLCGGSPECPPPGFSRLDTGHREKIQHLKAAWGWKHTYMCMCTHVFLLHLCIL